MNDKSILESIKGLLGILNIQTSFDNELIFHINSVFSILTQLGVGPKEGFSIKDKNTVWSDYIKEKIYLDVIDYMYLKIKLIFDPPESSTVIDMFKTRIDELEWRITNTRKE